MLKRRHVPAALSLLALSGLTLALLASFIVAADAAGPPRIAPAAATYDWPQFNGDAQHSGDNTRETIISPANVASLQQFGQWSLPAVADGAPAYLASVTIDGASHNALFLTTTDGRILALDAQSGATLWSHQYGPGACTINNGGTPCYTTSSPVVDPGRAFVYSYGLDGKVHKYRIADGTEVASGGWPELSTTKPFDEKGSSALSLATASNGASYLYVTNGGYPGDNGDYQGHLTTINLATGAQNVFNADCSNQTVHFVETPSSPDCSEVQTAIWARPGTIYDAANNKLYVDTGNGTFNPAGHNWGDSVLGLNPNGTGSNGNPLDSYTPADYQSLQDGDTDLGSTAPAILPVPANSRVPHLAVQGGKDAKLRLLNLDNLSGQGGPGRTGGEIGDVIDVPQGGEVLTQPAVWVDSTGSTWVFVANDNGISGLRVVFSNCTPALQPVWQNGSGGSSPLVANGVLYAASGGTLRARDPATGNILWSGSIGGIHWESPIVANGAVYVTDESGNLNVFTLNGVAPAHPTARAASSSRVFLPFVANGAAVC